MICVDTSFLISLYGTDVNTPAARQLLAAAAVTLGAAEFWSFDARQRALALAEGLMVRP